jgi:hypothetical protein
MIYIKNTGRQEKHMDFFARKRIISVIINAAGDEASLEERLDLYCENLAAEELERLTARSQKE